MDGLDDVKRLKQFAQEQYTLNDTQSANTFIIASSIFLAILVQRNGWTIIAQLCVLVSALNVLVGAGIIFVQRFQFLRLLNETTSIEHVEQDPEAIHKLVNDTTSVNAMARARRLINQGIIVGYALLVISFALLILTLAGI